MSNRTASQKIGAQGHKWFSAHIEEHQSWLSRDLNEDFGIDMEIEFDNDGFRGDLIKVQIKSQASVERKDGQVGFNIERKYLEYASSCRYPVILVLVCLETKKSWYIWLQEWLLTKRIEADPLSLKKKSWTEWVSESKTVSRELSSDLKNIALWKGNIQLVLSLQDAMRCAAALGKKELMSSIVTLINESAPFAGKVGINALIGQVINLGNKAWGTLEGNLITGQLFELIKKSGNCITFNTVEKMVIREDTYSRTGINALAIFYDEHFDYAKSLNLSSAFKNINSKVAYYCALREEQPEKDLFITPNNDGFIYAGLKFFEPDNYFNMCVNRGASAMLDCLFLAE
ncbi:DUF4365 domain-containing protein [Aliivibrio fischeri]|uniref:DUF4365 domain-containing protein n=1 Tax=Aliivibrio fischeri TaxID=668 RepID=UPI0007C4D116|nr:DUF4365 domain-containing protein [Aliivibrio fischeri]MBP3154591.1 DUF4365 domain-containing protein [Aliivibrio fischeri]